MNRIDVSAIQPLPSKLSSDPDDNTLEPPSHPDDPHSHSRTIPTDHAHSFTSDHLRRHAIFHPKEQPTRSDLGGARPKIAFRIPKIEEYYIRQSRENINPIKVHRMESMIETQPRDERTSVHGAAEPAIIHKQQRHAGKLWAMAAAVVGLALLTWVYAHLTQ